DLLLWAVADDLEALRAFEVRLAGTRLWAWSTRPYAYLAARRRSQYLGEHRHDGGEHAAPAGPVGDKSYVVVYPMTKKRTWYALPAEERTRIMAAHFAVGHRYPDIRIHTGYSFGIDDNEFVVAFECDDVREFLALVADLRETESSAYTQLGVDAAVLYADIMLPLDGMGVPFRIEPEIGPIIERPVRTARDVDALRVVAAEEATPYLFESIRALRASLPPDVALIGFAGAP